jgi:CheY-like chemotaxis protein
MYGKFVDDGVINLVMEVMDSGKGIKQEDIEKLFNDFTQLNTCKNDNVEGVGLGLAITRSIVEAMGGGIGVKSEYGKGSTFTITLPQKYRSREALATVKNPESKSALLCERNEIYADTLAFSIENLGLNYTIVSTDAELHEKVLSRSYDFIFISVSLYSQSKDIIMKYRNKAKIVVLTKFGESVPEAVSCNNLSTLARPVYSVPIANVLNGVPGNFSYGDSKEFIVRFTAPDAKVLIVDDIITNLKVAQGLLMPYNMQVVLCKSGMTAIKAIQSRDYDLVFMDHKMPEMDGIEATQRIRALGVEDSYYKNVPIVALTANAVSGTKEMFLENGFDDFLSKPIDTVKLNEIIEKWVPRNKQSGVLQLAV